MLNAKHILPMRSGLEHPFFQVVATFCCGMMDQNSTLDNCRQEGLRDMQQIIVSLALKHQLKLVFTNFDGNKGVAC